MRYLFYVTFIFILSLVGGCSKSPSLEKKPLVVVSLSPYDFFVKSIAGDTLDVRVAVPANYNPHLFEPTPKQIEGFQKALVWFGIGENFERILLSSLKSYDSKLVAVDLSKDIPLESYHQDTLAIGSCSSHHREDHHHHHHDEGIDRHFWMSPRLSLLQVEKIARTLINRFPEHASLYQHNLLEFQKKMTALDVEISQLLHPVEGHAIIVSHPSLGYFCSDYHLIQISIECEGKTPLPSDLKQIFSLSKQYPVLCVLTQEQFDNKGAITIAQKLQLPLHSINPNDPDYFENIHTLVNHLLQHP